MLTFNMKIYINNNQCVNFRIGKSNKYGYTSVVVNNNAACHLIPTILLNNGGEAFTGGNSYKVELLK